MRIVARTVAANEGLPKRVGQPALGPLPQNPSLLLAGPGPARPSPTPHFYRRARAGPAWQIPHLYRRALGPPGPPKSLTFIDGAWPAQTPHFYWPDPSLLSARPGGVTPALPQPALPHAPPEQPPPIALGLAPSLFGKPSCDIFSGTPTTSLLCCIVETTALCCNLRKIGGLLPVKARAGRQQSTECSWDTNCTTVALKPM